MYGYINLPWGWHDHLMYAGKGHQNWRKGWTRIRQINVPLIAGWYAMKVPFLRCWAMPFSFSGGNTTKFTLNTFWLCIMEMEQLHVLLLKEQMLHFWKGFSTILRLVSVFASLCTLGW